jgi:Glycosyltransferase family 87
MCRIVASHLSPIRAYPSHSRCISYPERLKYDWRMIAQTKSSPVADRSGRNLLLGLLLFVCCLYSLLARDTYAADFRAYYVAAQASHAGLDPYLNQVNVDERFADGEWLQVNSRFIYPPSSLFLFSPLSHLPYKVAKVVWSTFMALLMVWLLMILRDRYPRAQWIALGLFLSLPMAANVDNGQVDILIFALTLAVFYVSRPWLAGLCLGLAIAIKVSPVLILLWLLATRRWKAALFAILSAAALTLASIRVWGLDRHREFIQHLMGHLSPNPAMLTHTYTMYKVYFGRFVVMGANSYSMHYFFGVRQNPLLHAAPVGLAMLLIYVAWMLRTRRRDILASDVGFFTFLVVALFANSLLWPAGLIACFPLTLLLVDRSLQPVRHGLILLLPFFVPIEFVANRRFLFWLIAAGFCLWEVRREQLFGDAPLPDPITADA